MNPATVVLSLLLLGVLALTVYGLFSRRHYYDRIMLSAGHGSGRLGGVAFVGRKRFRILGDGVCGGLFGGCGQRVSSPAPPDPGERMIPDFAPWNQPKCSC